MEEIKYKKQSKSMRIADLGRLISLSKEYQEQIIKEIADLEVDFIGTERSIEKWEEELIKLRKIGDEKDRNRT